MKEREEPTSKRELVTKTPSLIQRCQLRVLEETLIYDYMGSSEFEFGDQPKSLKRIFAEGMTTFKTTVHNDQGNSIPFYLVAGKEFDSRAYSKVINGLIEEKFKVKEYTYLRETVNKMLNKKRFEEDDKFLTTNVWFDFKNDVLFTPHQELSDKLVSTLEKIKTKWETPDPPHIAVFKEELKKVEQEITEKFHDWFVLDYSDIQEKRGKLLVWFNDGGEHSGWYTLDQLRAWDGKGKIYLRVKPSKK
jgi:hypothetical protein